MYTLSIFYISAPTSVRNALVRLSGDTIIVTWSPPFFSNGIILQYIVQSVNSSGKSYHYVPGSQNTLQLPYFRGVLIYVAAVNQYGQSRFELAKSNGMK